MKKIILCLIIMYAFASCKKDYTCSCTASGTSNQATLSHKTKKEATKDCTTIENTYKQADPSAVCSLK